MDNPPPNILANSQHATSVIVDARTGEVIATSGQSMEVMVDAAGGRHVETVERVVRGHDLRIIKAGEPIYGCGCGCRLTLLARESVLFCTNCQIPIARQHMRSLNGVPVCPSCYGTGFFLWLQRFVGKVFVWLRRGLQ